MIDFPWALNEFIQLENANRKLDLFIDLSPPDLCKFEKAYDTKAYFLET